MPDPRIRVLVSRGGPADERVEALCGTDSLEVVSCASDEEARARLVRDGAQVDCVESGLAARLARALGDSEERFDLAARGANDGLWEWQLDDDRFVFTPRLREILGCTHSELETSSEAWFERVHESDRENLRAQIAALVDGRTESLELEVRMLHGDGMIRWMLCRALPARRPEGGTSRVLGSMTDVTYRRSAQQQILHDAFHDALTGLPNRALFLDRLEMAMMRHRRAPERPYAVLLLDVDRFKIVNDSLGHPIGDQMLVAVAHRLRKCLREHDTVARLGGDEFTILLEPVESLETARQVAERIHRSLSMPFVLEGREVYTGVSIGITMSAEDAGLPEDLLRDAGTAMNRAKSGPRTPIEVFEPRMHETAVTRLELEGDLRRALRDEEFFLHYQPIVSLTTGRVTAFEALVRWQHPERGLVSPADFVPAAEETGLIVPIGEWVLRRGCHELAAWNAAGFEVGLCVNVSPKQFESDGLLDHVEAVLQGNKIQRERLTLEITESLAMGDANLHTVKQLVERGVRVSIDDFGTGYSSLGSLKRFPLHSVKVDRSFIRDVPHDAEDAAIAAAIVAMSHHLSLRVVAEGVETHEQVAFLRAHGCDAMQGFLFSKPIEAQACMQLLRSGRTLPRELLRARDETPSPAKSPAVEGA